MESDDLPGPGVTALALERAREQLHLALTAEANRKPAVRGRLERLINTLLQIDEMLKWEM